MNGQKYLSPKQLDEQDSSVDAFIPMCRNVIENCPSTREREREKREDETPVTGTVTGVRCTNLRRIIRRLQQPLVAVRLPNCLLGNWTHPHSAGDAE